MTKVISKFYARCPSCSQEGKKQKVLFLYAGTQSGIVDLPQVHLYNCPKGHTLGQRTIFRFNKLEKLAES